MTPIKSCSKAQRRLQLKMWLFAWLSSCVPIAIGIVFVTMAFIPALASQLYLTLLLILTLAVIYFTIRRGRYSSSYDVVQAAARD